MTKIDQDKIEKLVGGDSNQSLENYLKQECEQLGLKGFSLFRYDQFTQQVNTLDMRPDEYKKLYYKLGGIYVDPIAFKSVTTSTTFRWDQALNGYTLSNEQLNLLGTARDFGVREGISTPAASSPRHHYTINWFTDSYKINAEIFQNDKSELETIAYGAFETFEKARKSEPVPELTPRERDVLSWIARGKTSEDVADILNVSATTVESHVRAAIEKLQASNRTHAAVKAVILKLISP